MTNTKLKFWLSTYISGRLKLSASGGVESPSEVSMFCFSKTSSLVWIVVYMAYNKADAYKIKDTLSREGFLVKLKAVLKEDEESLIYKFV